MGVHVAMKGMIDIVFQIRLSVKLMCLGEVQVPLTSFPSSSGTPGDERWPARAHGSGSRGSAAGQSVPPSSDATAAGTVVM